MAEQVGKAVSLPVAQATSQYKESFLDRIRNQLSQLQN